MGYTDTQKAAIDRFRTKFSTDTKTEIDEKMGMPKPLTDDQKAKLADLSNKLRILTMCRA